MSKNDQPRLMQQPNNTRQTLQLAAFCYFLCAMCAFAVPHFLSRKDGRTTRERISESSSRAATKQSLSVSSRFATTNENESGEILAQFASRTDAERELERGLQQA